MVGLLIMLTGYVGKNIAQEVKAMRETFIELKVELAVNKSSVSQNLGSISRRLDDTKVSLDRLSDRVRRVEMQIRVLR